MSHRDITCAGATGRAATSSMLSCSTVAGQLSDPCCFAMPLNYGDEPGAEWTCQQPKRPHKVQLMLSTTLTENLHLSIARRQGEEELSGWWGSERMFRSFDRGGKTSREPVHQMSPCACLRDRCQRSLQGLDRWTGISFLFAAEGLVLCASQYCRLHTCSKY